MMKNSAVDFYFKAGLWTFFCLIVASICSLANAVIVNVEKNRNESAAVQALSTIRQLQRNHAAQHRGRFAANFEELIRSAQLDEKFGGPNPVVDGYAFTMNVSAPTSEGPAFYRIAADPLDSENPTRHFYFDSTLGAIKATEENRPARAADPSI